MQLAELRDLVVRRPAVAERREEPASGASAAAPAGLSAWEAMKAGLLSGQTPSPTVPAAASAQAPPQSRPAADPFDGPPLVPPVPVDFAAADRGDLRDAVEARDLFITELLRRLRAAEAHSRPADDWKELAQTPDEFRGRLESLERRLEQTLRLSEVELSLERARLGREAVRLRQAEDSTRQTMSRFGLDDDEPAAEEEPDAPADGRWMRMLGLKRQP